MTIPPSKPDQSPQPDPFMGCGFVLAYVLVMASFVGLGFLLAAVAPYRIHCTNAEGKGFWGHGSWDVRSAESFLREKTKEGKRCQREYLEQ